jgi:hypothetical protein
MWFLKGLLFRNREMGEIMALNEPMGSTGKSGMMAQGSSVPWEPVLMTEWMRQRQNSVRS